jgi:hypothetical protein
MALRQREVEVTLCDTLEAALRAVGDAIVRNDAAAARAQSAVALLRDLARRGSDLIALIAAFQTPAVEPRERGAITEAARQESDRFDDTSHGSVTDWVKARVVDALMSDDDHAASLLQQLPLPLPDNEAPAGGRVVPASLFEPVAENAEQTDAGQNIVIASELFCIEAMALASVASPANEVTPRAAVALPQQFVDAGAAPPSDSRAVPNDILAALHALSEEELIALFS